ncbi:MAG: hypothetical protein AAB434_13565 [Planctomycetota bacterium]
MEPARSKYLGLFLAALASVALELILTRIFSVTSWYHFAFVAVSIAMFGITAGAVAVEFLAGRKGPDGDARLLRNVALWFGPGAALAVFAAVGIPFEDPRTPKDTLVLALTYLLEAVPFFFCGALTSLVLRAHPTHAGSLYAVDLVGAALGCALVVPMLEVLDGPSAALAMAVVAGLSALVLSSGDDRARGRAVVATVALGVLLLANTRYSMARIYWDKMWGGRAPVPTWERWNAFSRIRVQEMGPSEPAFWGAAPAMPKQPPVDQMYMDIDGGAATWLTRWTGDPKDIEFLKWDVTAAGHYLVKDAKVLSLGVGGGRDLLTSIAFGQKSATGVEINEAILDADLDVFGRFTGPLDRLPGVRLVNDEARSWTARTDERFDLIVMSLTDTAAASSAGAYVLTENSLYTKEAIRLFHDHLTERGVLSITRWHLSGFPAEMWRLLALGAATLKDLGVADPRLHLLSVHRERPSGSAPEGFVADGCGTMLLSRSPLDPEAVRAWVAKMEEMGFVVDLAPGHARDPLFERIAETGDAAELEREHGIDLSPPTDDRPFYFHMQRLTDVLTPFTARPKIAESRANRVLGALLVVTMALAALFIVVPLWRLSRRGASSGPGSSPRRGTWALFFVSIGVAFMLVEISQMQRLILFLGHPIYGLSVVLFGLLVSSGFGSFASGALARRERPALAIAFVPLLVLLVVFGFAAPRLLAEYAGASTLARVWISLECLLPIGFFMGFPFPLAMGIAGRRDGAPLAWFYGVNGAASVCASVISMVLSLTFGISAAFWTGVAIYVAAWGLLAAARRP